MSDQLANPRNARVIGFGVSRLGRYLRAHWRGELSLARSFWLDFVLATLLCWKAASLLATGGGPAWLAPVSTAAALGVYWLVIYPWQLVGVLRAARRDVAGTRNTVLGPVAPVAAVACLLMLVPQALEVVRLAERWTAPPLSLAAEAPAEDEAPRRYTLRVVGDGTLVRLRGSFDHGVTRALRTLLEANPQVQAIILDSDGGSVFEARGVGNVIIARGFDTYSLDGCNSSCTLAFAAGTRRWLARGAPMGFHRYHLDGARHPFIDVEEEQRHDLEFLASRDVEPDFLAGVFRAPHEGIWFPSAEELESAGLVHATLGPVASMRLTETP